MRATERDDEPPSSLTREPRGLGESEAGRELGLGESTVACTGVIEHSANPAHSLVRLSWSMTLADVLLRGNHVEGRQSVERASLPATAQQVLDVYRNVLGRS